MSARPRLVETIADLRKELAANRAAGCTVGFVPTMGFLHAGHASLMEAARRENDLVLVSVFVNPLQFAPSEDFADYPRDLERDLDVCRAAGVDLVFHPSVDEMYPEHIDVTVSPGEVGDVLEGASRPDHFRGVATVVSKLFNIAGECRAYFGEKDAQQLVVIRRLARALDFPVEVVGRPTIREPDGLAMSSRNSYLAPDERRAAVVLKRAIDEAARLVSDGERSGRKIVEAMAAVVDAEPLARLDYSACVDPETLAAADEVDGPVLCVLAAFVGKARLIDNVTVDPAPSRGARTGTSTRGLDREG